MKNFLLEINNTKNGFIQHLTSKKKLGAGFTLVEALVAISILLISIVGPLSIVAESIKTANLGKDQITAFYLAQEAVEYIRNIRDTNVLEGKNWLSTDIVNCYGNATCRVDAVNNNTVSCANDSPAGVCKKLNKFKDISSKLTTYRYDQPSGYVETTFTRSVNVTDIINGVKSDHEAIITVTMNWTSNLIPRSFTIVERIFNWSGI